MTTPLPARVDTVVIGAGQAGLTMSWHLQRAGRDHVLLERRSSLGGGWQDRWDAFRLVSPNWSASFPDDPYADDDPDGFMPRDELIGRVAGYADVISAPVILDTAVAHLSKANGHFDITTGQGPLEARTVVVATGGFHVPHVPAAAEGLAPHVLSLHAHEYRRESDLPPGAVLLVGSGQTGVQLTEELMKAGREVYLCVGSAGRVPRHYRGHDIFHWFRQLVDVGPTVGHVLPTVDSLPDPGRRVAANPQLSGHDGGHEVDARRLGREGVHLLGRLTGIDGRTITLATDLVANLDAADAFFAERFQGLIDDFIEAAGVEAPPAEPPLRIEYQPPIVEELDLDASGITSIIWTSGYRPDLSWIEPGVTDEMGFAVQDHGVSNVPGLYFIGGLWQFDQASATLLGVQRDAQALAERMGLDPAPAGR